MSFTSLAITRDAPAATQIPTAKMPIGPHPVISTVAPGISAVSAVWNALPIGSWMPPMSYEMSSSRCQMFVAGIAMKSAKQPSRSTPMMCVFGQTCALPVRQSMHVPSTMWPSAVTRSPSFTSGTSGPTRTTSPANSWPTVNGGLQRPLAQSSHS